MRTTIDMPGALLAAAKAASLARGETLSGLVVKAVERHLDPVGGSRPRVKLPTCGSQGPAPTWEQIRQLLDEADAAPYRSLLRVAEPTTEYRA
jgi:hypothetical protein